MSGFVCHHHAHAARQLLSSAAPEERNQRRSGSEIRPDSAVLVTGGWRQRRTKASLSLHTVRRRRIYGRPLLRSSGRMDGDLFDPILDRFSMTFTKPGCEQPGYKARSQSFDRQISSCFSTRPIRAAGCGNCMAAIPFAAKAREATTPSAHVALG